MQLLLTCKTAHKTFTTYFDKIWFGFHNNTQKVLLIMCVCVCVCGGGGGGGRCAGIVEDVGWKPSCYT